METPVLLLRLIGDAVLGASGGDVTGRLGAEQLPSVARAVWDRWCHAQQNEAERQAELEALVQAAVLDVRLVAADIVAELAARRSEATREALTTYLTFVPVFVRNTFRRPADPRGTTLPAGFSPDSADDLLLFLPPRLPRFRVGDAPLPGGEWQLVDLLGLSGTSEVWRAKSPAHPGSSSVVLKLFVDAWAAKVLRNDARLLDRLILQARHPGIVPLRQTYLNSDPPCLEYEYVPGGNLSSVVYEWRRQQHGAAPEQVSRLVRRLADIVGFAHHLAQPIVHRALKPANVLVQRTPTGKINVRVADFGSGGPAISHALRQALRGVPAVEARLAALRGAATALYTSPQQLAGADPDPRDDVYALGILWYQLLTGDLASGRPTGAEWADRLRTAGVPAHEVDLIAACVQENPGERPRDAGALAEQLRKHSRAAVEGEAAVATAGEPLPPDLPRRVSSAIGMVLTLIPAGTFKIGSPTSEAERGSDEGPQHEVTITRPFYVAINPVTQREYQAVMGENPSYFNARKGGGAEHPVEHVSWEDAMEFCRRLSNHPAEKEAGRFYRLPTEAEWEYACRANTSGPFWSGPGLSSREANFNGHYPYGGAPKGPYLERTTKVGSYLPNPHGLYDMHGNVWEWCADYYDRGYYKISPRYDPPGPATGTMRVVRGGSCYTIGRFCRSAYRFGVAPVNRDLDVGFRVVMTIEKPQ